MEINDQNVSGVLSQDKPVLLDFWASFCAPCLRLSPIIEEIGKEMKDKAIVGKVDTEADNTIELVQKYSIRNIPTIFIIKGGEIKEKIVGLTSKDNILEKLNKYI